MQHVQNFSARLITGSYRYDHITPVLKSLHWLPVEQRIRYKIAVLGFKCVNGSPHGYLQNLVELYTPRRTLRSSSDKLTLSIPKVRTLYGERSFRYHCAVEWNTLPYDIRYCESLLKLSWKPIFFIRHIVSQIVFYLLQWIMYCLLNVLTRYTEIYLSHINLHRFDYLVKTSYTVFS